jgi:hypothetical protein
MLDADIIQEEVDAPSNNWCCSGHYAASVFKRAGPKSNPEPTKFFKVTTKDHSGIYCEPCLIIARWLAKNKK